MSRNEIESALQDDISFAAARRWRRATVEQLRTHKLKSAGRRAAPRDERDREGERRTRLHA